MNKYYFFMSVFFSLRFLSLGNDFLMPFAFSSRFWLELPIIFFLFLLQTFTVLFFHYFLSYARRFKFSPPAEPAHLHLTLVSSWSLCLFSFSFPFPSLFHSIYFYSLSLLKVGRSLLRQQGKAECWIMSAVSNADVYFRLSFLLYLLLLLLPLPSGSHRPP